MQLVTCVRGRMIAIFSLQIVLNALLVWQQSLCWCWNGSYNIKTQKSYIVLGLQYFSQGFISNCGCVSSCVCCLSFWFIPHCKLVLSAQAGQATRMVSAWPTCCPIAVWQYNKKKTSCLNIAFIYIDCVLPSYLTNSSASTNFLLLFPKEYDFQCPAIVNSYVVCGSIIFCYRIHHIYWHL
jgi:hypothetical protein